MSAEPDLEGEPAGPTDRPASPREQVARPVGAAQGAASGLLPSNARPVGGARAAASGLLISDLFGPSAMSLRHEPLARLAVNAGWPLLFCWLAAEELAGDRAGAARTAGCALAAVVVLGWSGWTFVARYRWKGPTVAGLLLGVVAVASGLLCPLAPSAVGMLAAVGVAGGWVLPLVAAGAVVGSGLAALVASQPIAHLSSGLLTAGFAASIVGLVGGIARRQGAERDRQLAELGFEHQRLEVEQARGEVLAERNRMARDVHDVLAHTLGALAVQLEAADALVGRPDPVATERLGEVIRQSRELVVSGLEETRRAVRTLRDEPFELVQRLEQLVEREPPATHPVALAVVGEPRALAPASASALYRAAQEGLANARKHAAGALVELTLAFEPGGASLVVANGAGGSEAGTLAGSGSGVGLVAMRERVELAGGTLDAAASGEGWRVVARVPG